MKVYLYHRTTPDIASAILRDGFRDGSGAYMTDGEHSGVWLSDRPLDANEGASGEALLRVSIEADLDSYEWVEDGKGYREWLVPAAMLNKLAKIEPAG